MGGALAPLRDAMALLQGVLLTLALTPLWMRAAGRWARQVVREDGPPSHRHKRRVPTMGGVALGLTAVSCFIPWTEGGVRWALLAATLGFGGVGLADDLLKLCRGSPRGLSARQKLMWQAAVSLGVLLLGRLAPPEPVRLPWGTMDPGWLWWPLGMAVLMGSCNAVNLSDGLDGLAAGLSAMLLLALGGFCPPGDLRTGCWGLAGAALGFLWYNAYPARVFMGDVGSQCLGGTIGTLAVLGGGQWFLLLAGGVLVAEALSVIIQVASWRWRRRRVFRMAPLHHHWELKGWPEPTVTVRMWLAGALCALLAMAAWG